MARSSASPIAFPGTSSSGLAGIDEASLRELLNSIDEGFCTIEVIFDAQDRAIDYRFVEANRAFEQQTGLHDALGRTMREMVPDHEQHWFDIYGRIALTGTPARFEDRAAALGRWYDVYAFRIGDPAQRRVAILFRDVIERRRAEEVLRASEERQTFLLELSDDFRAAPDAAAMGKLAVAALARHLKLDRCFLNEMHNDEDVALVADDFEYRAPGLSPVTRRNLYADFSEAMRRVENGEPLIVDDIAEDRGLTGRDKASFAARDIGAVIVGPLRRGRGNSIWALTAASVAPRKWTRDEYHLVLEVAERTWAAMERACTEEALRRSELWLQALVQGVPQLVWRAANGGRWTWASPQWTDYTGQLEPNSHGWGWLAPVHPDDRDRVTGMWSTAIEQGEFAVDYRLFHASECRYRWFQTRATPVRDDDGAIIEWLGTSTDIDDLRQLQDRHELLVAELQHRARNILTVIRSVFGRTLQTSDDPDEMADHFRGRLDALARTQVVTTRNAAGTADMEDLIRDELLSVGVSDERRVTLVGPDVTLPVKAAEAIGLVIHELTTNALKYGALKVAGATLNIRWSTNLGCGGERRLVLTWHEQGVPALDAIPTRHGFGRELIEEALPYRLGAETKLEFLGGGIRCTIDVPLPEFGGGRTVV